MLVAAAIALFGIGFTVRFRFYFFRHPLRALSLKREKRVSGVSGFRALCVALGGTIGVGNTVGVAAAIRFGGPGAIFWMWVSAFFSMALKYAEVDLALKFRTRSGGGAMILLQNLNKPFPAILFSVACVFASFFMGNLTQSASAAASLEHASGVPKFLTALLIAAVCIAVFSGGKERLGRVSGALVPLMGVIFVSLSVACLVVNRAQLFYAVQSIFTQAFSPLALVSGTGATLFFRGLSAGFERAIFSNEAGLGSAPLIHSEAQNSPVRQGILGATEVFFDTIVICTLCALVILSSPIQTQISSVSALCAAVFTSALGSVGGTLFSLSLVFFAVTSILAWCYYGQSAIRFLFASKNVQRLYFSIFFALPFLAPLIPVDWMIRVSDLCNACMVFPNLYALFCLRNKVDPPQSASLLQD